MVRVIFDGFLFLLPAVHPLSNRLLVPLACGVIIMFLHGEVILRNKVTRFIMGIPVSLAPS